MSKSFVFGFVVGIALLIVAGVGASRLQRKSAEQTRAEEENRRYEAEIHSATPVQSGTLSEQQRFHSRLYSGYRERRGGRTISGLVAEAKGKSRIVKTIAFVGVGSDLVRPETPEQFFGELTLSSDIVVRARVIGMISQITEDDSFVFTDYQVFVIEVLRNYLPDPVTLSSTITVTRPGGSVLLDDIIVDAQDLAFEPLPLNGNEVLLFLRYIPETGAFTLTQDTGSFELVGSNLKPLTNVNLPPGALEGKAPLLQTIRAITKQ